MRLLLLEPPSGYEETRFGNTIRQASTAGLALHLDASSIGVNRPSSDRQAETAAAALARAAFIQAIEPIEDSSMMLSIDSWTGVENLDDLASLLSKITRMRISAPGGLYLTALSTMLTRASRRSTGSTCAAADASPSTTSD